MTTLAIFAAAGALSWLIRATFVVFVPSGDVANRVAALVRYAAPAAFASMVTTSVAAAAQHTGYDVWRFGVAVLVAGAAARQSHNLVLTIAAGAGAITLLTVF